MNKDTLFIWHKTLKVYVGTVTNYDANLHIGTVTRYGESCEKLGNIDPQCEEVHTLDRVISNPDYSNANDG